MTNELNQEQHAEQNMSNLLRCYTFDNFVIGENNNFALAFAKAVAESPGVEYNPLFIYSNVGLGKTHLINSIGNALLERMPDKNVLYISSQQFEAELVEAIQFNKIETFRQKYISLDVLLLDDIQFIASRESAQQEFFHAFNILFNSGKQIVLTSDRPPSTLSTLEQRLRSRFEGGIITEIHPPDIETRMAILSQKMREKGVLVPDDVIRLLCENIKDDIRKLEGALKETIAFARLTNKPVNVAIAEQVINQKLAQYDKINQQINPLIDKSTPELKHNKIQLESPNDSLPDNKNIRQRANPLNIDVSLPPEARKINIKDPGKNMNLNTQSPEEHATSQTPKIDLSKTNIKRSSESSKINLGSALTRKQEQAPQSPDAEDDQDMSAEELLKGDGISLTSAFASHVINNKINEIKNTPQQESNAKDAAEPKQEQTDAPQKTVLPVKPKSAPVAQSAQKPDQPIPASPAGGMDQGGNQVSLTNIFSSRDVKEKINKIIAVGAEQEGSDESIDPPQPPVKSNIFIKEHKKKLEYELKFFDVIVKKIDRGRAEIIDFDAYDVFRDNLEQAHASYTEQNYQQGLDCIKQLKTAYAAMLSQNDRKAAAAKAGMTASFPVKKALLLLGILLIGALATLIFWKLVL